MKNLAINTLLLLLAATLLSTSEAFVPSAVHSRPQLQPLASSLAAPEPHSFHVSTQTRPSAYRHARKKVFERIKQRCYTTLTSVLTLSMLRSKSSSGSTPADLFPTPSDDPLATWRLACSLQVNEDHLNLFNSAPWMG